MTDHKALRLVDVLRDQRQCDEDGVMCIVSRQAVDEAVQIIESLAAAPAASEGEDGAVATLLPSDPYDDSGAKGPWMHMNDWERLRSLPAGTKLYTRPAAQVAATPKHDEGRIEAAVRLFVDRGWCDEFGTPHQDLRELLGQVLATQPAARRVTDVERRLMKAASEAVELIRSIPERKLLALDSDPHPPSALSVAADEIAAALESFAQPAEGVSRKKHDGPCWRNSHADCGC